MWPPHALPTQSTGSVRPRRSSACSVATTSSSNVKSRAHSIALAMRGPVDGVDRAVSSQGVDQWAPGSGVDKKAVPQHNRRAGADASDVQAAEVGLDEIDTRGVHRAVSIYFGTRNFGIRSILTTHGHVKGSAARSSGDRAAAGQVVAGVSRRPRRATRGRRIRRRPRVHFQIFGNIRMGGIRLTELADRAQLSLAAASELVNDLVDLGYLTRRPDPADGRAKLIDLTKRGQALMADAGGRVVDIERRWSKVVGERNFAQMTTHDAAPARRARPEGLTRLASAPATKSATKLRMSSTVRSSPSTSSSISLVIRSSAGRRHRSAIITSTYWCSSSWLSASRCGGPAIEQGPILLGHAQRFAHGRSRGLAGTGGGHVGLLIELIGTTPLSD